MDRCDLEPCDGVHKNQPRVRALLRRANRPPASGDGTAALPPRLQAYSSARSSRAAPAVEGAETRLRQLDERSIPPRIPADFIRRIFQVMGKAHWHVFQVLTKRADRLAELAPELLWSCNISIGVDVKVQLQVAESTTPSRKCPTSRSIPSPSNHYLDNLASCPSMGIDWVIVGQSRDPARGLRSLSGLWMEGDQCLALDVPFFFKQWGGVRRKHPGERSTATLG